MCARFLLKFFENDLPESVFRTPGTHTAQVEVKLTEQKPETMQWIRLIKGTVLRKRKPSGVEIN
jgi:hypothetical protein